MPTFCRYPSRHSRGHQRPSGTNNHFTSKRRGRSAGTKTGYGTPFPELLIWVSRFDGRRPHCLARQANYQLDLQIVNTRPSSVFTIKPHQAAFEIRLIQSETSKETIPEAKMYAGDDSSTQDEREVVRSNISAFAGMVANYIRRLTCAEPLPSPMCPVYTPLPGRGNNPRDSGVTRPGQHA